MKSFRYKVGVTLVELLIVVAIIALLTTMVIGVATRIQTQSSEQLTESTFALLESALQEYYEYTGEFPEYAVGTELVERSETLYGALNRIPSSRKILEKISGSLIKHNVDTGATPPIPEIYDPWGMVLDYWYDLGDNFPKLISAGPDRKPNTPDDISSR